MKRGKRIRRLVIFTSLSGLLLVLLAFAASNLYLMSRPGRTRIENKISSRLHLETTIQGASWSPWNGVTIYGLHTRQPEQLREAIHAPFLLVRSIRVIPDWKRLLRRSMIIREIIVLDPELTVPLELATLIPQKETVPPAIAANLPTEKSTQQPTGPTTAQPLQPTTPALPNPPATAVPSAAPPDLGPTAWLRLDNAKITIATGFTLTNLINLKHVSGKIPLGGNAADSTVRIGQCEALGIPLVKQLEIPFRWSSPLLIFDAGRASEGQIAWSAKVAVALTGGIPFQIDTIVPPQDEKSLTLPMGFTATIGKLAMQSRLQGLILAPATWNGQGLAQVEDVTANADGQTTAFRNGQALLVFQNGLLQCPDARLVGETLSFMGNAAVLSDGRASANLRIVAAPDTLVALSRHTEPDHRAPSLTPLSTPQRAALDLGFFGAPGKYFYRSNPSAPPVPLQ